MRSKRSWNDPRHLGSIWLPILVLGTAWGLHGCASSPPENASGEPPAQIEEIAVAEEAPEPLPPTDVQAPPSLEDAPVAKKARRKPRGLTIADARPARKKAPRVDAAPPAEPVSPPVAEEPPPPPPSEEAPPPPPPEPPKAEEPPPPPREPPPAAVEPPFYMDEKVQLGALGVVVLLAALYFMSKRNKG